MLDLLTHAFSLLVRPRLFVNSSVEAGEGLSCLSWRLPRVVKIDGNKLSIAFEKAGEKKVVDSFVERV